MPIAFSHRQLPAPAEPVPMRFAHLTADGCSKFTCALSVTNWLIDASGGAVTTLAEARALCVLMGAHAEGRAVSTKFLHSFHGGAKATFARFIRRLETRGVITPRTDQQDRRVRLLLLTDTFARKMIDFLPVVGSTLNECTYAAMPNVGERVKTRTMPLPPAPSELPLLAEAWQRWTYYRGCTKTPDETATAPVRDGQIAAYSHVVDVRSDTAADFLLETIAPVADRMRDLIAEKRVGSLRALCLRELILDDYMQVKACAMPSCHNVTAQINGREFKYARLILPFSGSRGEIVKLIVIVQRRHNS